MNSEVRAAADGCDSVGGAGAARARTRTGGGRGGVVLHLSSGSGSGPRGGEFEPAAVVREGASRVAGQVRQPGHLGYLGLSRTELAIETLGPTRAMLIGGVPFPDQLVMWWNFIARTHEEMSDAYRRWSEGDERFGSAEYAMEGIAIAPHTGVP